MILRAYLRIIKNYFISKKLRIRTLNTKLVSRRYSTCLLFCITVSFLYLLGNLVNELFYKEIIDKYSEQCSAYPNQLIKTITENQNTYEQIEANLKEFNIGKGGAFITQNKSKLNSFI